MTMKVKAIRFNTSDNLTGGQKWYKVLSAGVMFSNKYSGRLDSDPARCEITEKAGKLNVSLGYLEMIQDNYDRGVLETVPYVDIQHQRDSNCGNITGVHIEDGGLYVSVNWNDKGKALVGVDGNGEYRYLSIDVSGHTNSKTGIYYPWVLKAASLTNDPVFKDQNILTLSERAKAQGEEKAGIKGGPDMDKIKEIFQKLLADVQGAMEGQEEGAFKTALHEAVEQFEAEMGIEEPGETDELVAKVPAGEPVKEGETKAPAGEKAQMSERSMLELAEKVRRQSADIIRLSEANERLTEKLERAEFSEKWGDRFMPADLEENYQLWKTNMALAEKHFSKLPVINLAEKGSSSDVQLSTVKDDEAAAIKLMDATEKIRKEKGISFSDAYQVAKSMNPELVSKLG